MPTEARMRAARCRDRAEECIKIAETVTDPKAKENYLEMAANYLAVAEAEMNLAERLERLSTTSSGSQGEPA
jgi:hypothetical protein